MSTSPKLLARCCPLVVAIVGVMFCSSAFASAAIPWGWQVFKVGAGQPLHGVSCPSTSLCVAVDSNGNALVSAEPKSGAGKWVTSKVSSNALSSVSCPTASLCVAADVRGDIIASTDPPGGAGKWVTSKVSSSALSGVSCPTTSLCLAVDSTGDIVSSTDPDGGPGAWSVAHVDDQTFTGCSQSPPAAATCQPGLVGISCPSPTACMAVDNAGNAFSDLAARTAASTWRTALAAGPSVNQYAAVYCSSAYLCIASCPVGVGSGACQGSVYNAGDVISWNPTTWSPPGTSANFATISPQPLTSLWCSPATTCFAANTVGDLYASADPAGAAWTWSATYVDTAAVSGGTCPSVSTCVATDLRGDVLVGTALTTANLKKLLFSTIVPQKPTASATAILRHGYTLRLKLPVSGHFTVSWYEVPKGARIASTKPRAMLVAHGAGDLKAGTDRLHVALTQKGRATLMGARKTQLRLTAVEVFAPADGLAASVTKQFVLGR